MKKELYLAPEVEVTLVAVEAGFNVSAVPTIASVEEDNYGTI